MGIGNLMGFGPKPSGGGNVLGLGGSPSGQAPNGKIRKVDFEGTRGQKFRDEARKIGTVRVHKITKENGKRKVESMVFKRTGPNKVEDLIKDSMTIGKTVSSRKYNIYKKGGFQSQKDREVFYKIGGSQANIKKRKKIANFRDPKGPTREEVAVKLKQQERFSRRNILGIQLDREKEKKDMASQLSHRREKGAKNAVDMRSGDRKVGAGDINVKRSEYSVSAQTGNGGLNKASKSGFANKIENAEDKQGNVADLSKHEAKDINKPNNTPMFIPSADK